MGSQRVTRRAQAQHYIRETVDTGRGSQLTGKEVAEKIGMDPSQARAILREMRRSGECPPGATTDDAPPPATDLQIQITIRQGDKVRDVIVLL